MVSLFSAPDFNVLKATHQVVCLCYRDPHAGRAIFPVDEIQAVVTALPYEHSEGYWYIMEKLGLDIAVWGEPDNIVAPRVESLEGASAEDTSQPNARDQIEEATLDTFN